MNINNSFDAQNQINKYLSVNKKQLHESNSVRS